MEQKAEKQKKGTILLWLGLAASLLVCICCVVASILLWFNRTNIPVVAELFATSTPTSTPTPTPTSTPTSTPTPTLTPTPLPVPGIHQPMTVKGISFILTNARFEDSYKHLDRTFTPTNAGETLLVVDGEVLSGESAEVGKWKVEVKDENGKIHIASVKITTTKANKTTFTWLIAVPQNTRELVLLLPDGQSINLSPLLED